MKLFKVIDEIGTIENKLSLSERTTNKALSKKGKELKEYVLKLRASIKENCHRSGKSHLTENKKNEF